MEGLGSWYLRHVLSASSSTPRAIHACQSNQPKVHTVSTECHAGFHRQCLFGGLRIGMYEPVKTFYMGSNPGEAPFITKVHSPHAHICLVIQHMYLFLRSLLCQGYSLKICLHVTGSSWTDNWCRGHHDCQPYRSGEGQDAGRARGPEAEIPQRQGCIPNDYQVRFFSHGGRYRGPNAD